jgi:hypothetical protein
LVATLLLLAACHTEDPATAAAPTSMDPVAALVRTSLDLRGVRPTEDEVAQVEADPAALDSLVDVYLADPRFEGRVRDLWSEIYLTRTESYLIYASQYGLDDQAAFEASVGGEALHILGYVAANDLPYSEIVTGDWTMADETLGAIWPVDYPAGSEGWIKTRYTDGRPAAGILATNSMWWRYTSTTSNANRKRANAASRILLCNDYLSRPIEFDRNINLLDEAAVNDALRENPACLNCHTSLDPIASYFYGFWWYDYTNPLEASYYYPERELTWRQYTDVAPGYYGQPGYSLSDLGHQIAADHRFPECAAEQAWELLLRRDATTLDQDHLNAARDAFVGGGLKLKTLIKAIVSDPMYRAPATDEQGFVPLKMATPDLLATQIEDLTGFRYTYGGYDLMRTDAVGYRTLAGGADGYNVTSTSTSPNATLMLVQERLAEASAFYTVNSEPQRLFASLDFTETPETNRAAMVSEIQSLHRRIFGRTVAADGEEVTAALELWSDVYAVERNARSAWAGVLSALLRDPDLLFY